MSNADLPLHRLSLRDAVTAIARGSLTARALADAGLARVAATDAAIEAWASLDVAHVHREADRCDASKAGGALAGVGVGIKDIIHTRDFATEMGSPAFAGYRPEHDAACVDRLRAAGGYVFGKTVTTEFAFMHPGKTRNPWNPAHTPGGSSSGSAAAVAAGHVAGALGTQNNGSVIRPAAYCGVVGFKPTAGTVSFAGINIFSETLDTLGTFTRDVRDAALLAGMLADEGTMALAEFSTAPKLAFLSAFPWTPVDVTTRDALAAAVRTLAESGARIRAVALPADWNDTLAVHRTIMLAEGARNLADVRQRSGAQLSAVLAAALDEGARIAADDYRAAMDKRMRLIDALDGVLGDCDAIVAPCVPTSAPAKLDATGDPSCCTLWSLLGAPAMSLPIGLDARGLPLGLQLAARHRDDSRLLGVAQWCAARLPFAGLR